MGLADCAHAAGPGSQIWPSIAVNGSGAGHVAPADTARDIPIADRPASNASSDVDIAASNPGLIPLPSDARCAARAVSLLFTTGPVNRRG